MPTNLSLDEAFRQRLAAYLQRHGVDPGVVPEDLSFTYDSATRMVTLRVMIYDADGEFVRTVLNGVYPSA